MKARWNSGAARHFGYILRASGVAFLSESYYAAPVKTLTVRLPELLFAEIESAAQARNVAKSEIVRERLEHGGKKKRSLWRRMEDLVIKSDVLPRDLSSKEKYLPGYGRNRSDR